MAFNRLRSVCLGAFAHLCKDPRNTAASTRDWFNTHPNPPRSVMYEEASQSEHCDSRSTFLGKESLESLINQLENAQEEDCESCKL